VTDPIPTAADVVAHLNQRFAARGLSFRIDGLSVLPYVNPMWLANWELAQAPAAGDREVVDEEVADARWRFPQILGDW
jgi:hypothetical protein